MNKIKENEKIWKKKNLNEINDNDYFKEIVISEISKLYLVNIKIKEILFIFIRFLKMKRKMMFQKIIIIKQLKIFIH